jgi:HK97 family phage portal protein
MRLFGLTIERNRKSLASVPQRGWFRIIGESFAGAWQKNVTVTQAELVSYPTLYACVMRIASDIGKLPFCLKQVDDNGIWKEVPNPAYSPVLRKPNGYQTAQQFREQWQVSKLTQGNTYALKRRDNRGVVIELYVLDPCRVQPMVTETGAVYYQLQTDRLNTLPEGYPSDYLLVPASEIIHDRCICIHHPLIGVPPLCAAYWPAVKNLKILQSSAQFFQNSSQPGGILTAPAGMSDSDAKTVQSYWDNNYSGDNAGKIAVIGADMKFTSFAMKGADSQLVEQMQYSDRQICQPFGIPPYIVGVGEIPAGLKVDDVTNTYYSLSLQAHIEAMEYLLDEGLGLSTKPELAIELDLEPLLRMDQTKQAEFESKLVGAKIKTPDEARAKFNLAPTGGGATLWGQQQDYPLGMLADRAEWDPSMQRNAPQEPPANNNDAAEEELRSLRAEVWQRRALEATREAIHA